MSTKTHFPFHKSLFIVGLAIALCWFIGLIMFAALVTLAKPVNITGSAVKTDAIVVFTGGPKRIETGMMLLEKKYSPYLFISGVGPELDENLFDTIWNNKDKSKTCCVELGKTARNTAENATETADWAAHKDTINSIILVTADYHMPRSMLELRRTLPEISVTPFIVESRKNLIKNPDYWMLVFSEYHKSFYTIMQLLFASSAKDV